MRPQRVVGQSPERNFERVYASHPDHLAAGEATMAAVYPDARNPFAHPELLEEGLEPWTVPEMYLATAGTRPTCSSTSPRRSIARSTRLRCHVSQMTDVEGLDARIREWNSANAAARRAARGPLAETYLRVDTE